MLEVSKISLGIHKVPLNWRGSAQIDSTGAYSSSATLRPADRSTSLSSQGGEFSLVISKASQFRLFDADLLS
jgi:hypothetical protein